MKIPAASISLFLWWLAAAPAGAGEKAFEQAAEPRLQDETVAWEWTGQTGTVRLAIHYVTVDLPAEDKAESSSIYEWRMEKGSDVETTRRLINGDPAVAGGKGTPETRGMDKLQAGLAAGLHDYFFGSGIRFQVAATNVIQVSQQALQVGSEAEYRGIVSKHHLKDAVNVYITPTLILDERGRMAGLTIRVPVYAVLVFEPHPRRLAHEIGHILGLDHTDHGVMWSIHPPILQVKERVKYGAFTPDQIKRMQAAIARGFGRFGEGNILVEGQSRTETK